MKVASSSAIRHVAVAATGSTSRSASRRSARSCCRLVAAYVYARGMTLAIDKALIAMAAGLLGFVVTSRDAEACKCRGFSQPLLVAPVDVTAPRNVLVRVALPNDPQLPIEVVVEGPARRAVRMTKRSTKHPDFTAVELKPVVPFESASKYEVVAIEHYRTGPVRKNLGTFSVTTETDTTPPRIDGVAAPRLVHQRERDGASCEVAGPWVEVPGMRAVDPGARDASLGYDLWVGPHAKDAAPTAWVESYGPEKLLRFGPTSLCASRLFDLPDAARFDVTVAAVDGAGNRSEPMKLVVDRSIVTERERPPSVIPTPAASTPPASAAASSSASATGSPARSKSGCTAARTVVGGDSNAFHPVVAIAIALVLGWRRRTSSSPLPVVVRRRG